VPHSHSSGMAGVRRESQPGHQVEIGGPSGVGLIEFKQFRDENSKLAYQILQGGGLRDQAGNIVAAGDPNPGFFIPKRRRPPDDDGFASCGHFTSEGGSPQELRSLVAKLPSCGVARLRITTWKTEGSLPHSRASAVNPRRTAETLRKQSWTTTRNLEPETTRWRSGITKSNHETEWRSGN